LMDSACDQADLYFHVSIFYYVLLLRVQLEAN
jgi:hypothetical protein